MNELEIIDLIRRTFRSRDRDLLDDVAFVRRGRGYTVFKADMFVRKTDLPPGMTLRQASRKAVVACMSDLLCKGVDPWGFLVSLGIPRALATERSMRLIALGLRDASVEYEVPILGGDVNEADDLVIDVAMAGFAKKMVKRGGALDGDALVATGPFGLTALGLGHLLKGRPLPRTLAAASLSSIYLPAPRKGLCKALIERGLVRSSMDSSDGLAITLNEMAKQSGREFLVTGLPVKRSFVEACLAAGLDPVDLAFHGGEEYEAVLSVPAGRLRAAIAVADGLGTTLLPFGRVLEGVPGVFFSPGGRRPRVQVEAEGWVHLS